MGRVNSTRMTSWAFVVAGATLVLFGEAAVAQGTELPPVACTLCTGDLPEICVRIPSSGGACGSNMHVNAGTSIDIGINVTCQFVDASIHATKTFGVAFDYPSGACEDCYMQVCWRHASYSARSCRRVVVDHWGNCPDADCGLFIPEDCVPLQWHYEYVTVISFTAGEPTVTPKCVDASCYCRRHISSSTCLCAEMNPPGQMPPPQPPAPEPPRPIAPRGSKSLTLDVRQLANKGTSVDTGPLLSLDHLSMAQLTDVQFYIESAIDEFGYQRDDTEVALLFEGGGVLDLAYADLALALNGAKAAKVASGEAFDVNGNGVVNFDDVIFAAEQVDAAARGWAWLSRADVDGDSSMTQKDLCAIVHAIYATE